MRRSRAEWPLVAYLLLVPLLGGYTVRVGHGGTSGTYQQRVDSHSNFCARNPTLCEELAIREKHEMALSCIQQKLSTLWPDGFSLNQRYRYNERTARREPVSPQQEEALRRAGGEGLRGTLIPDVGLHGGNPLAVVNVYDLKFPCPGTNEPQWYRYPEGHPHYGWDQGQMYQRAFGVVPARVAPRWGVLRPHPK